MFGLKDVDTICAEINWRYGEIRIENLYETNFRQDEQDVGEISR